jgi:RHS repeat-associated protein
LLRQTGVTTLFFLLLSFSPLSAQVPPGTGAAGAFNDQNFKVVTETVSQSAGCATSALPCRSRSAPSWIVTKRAGWAPELPGTHWIAPDPDHLHRPGNVGDSGSVTYRTEFMATPELTLNARVLADDNVVVSLNGNVVFSSTTAQHLSAAMFKLTGFVSGMNTVDFAVSNDGRGTNGLDVAFSDAGARPSGPALAFNHPASPDAMTFSPTAVGATSAQTLYVINNGDATATFAAIGPPTGSFSIDPNTQGCGAPLEPGAYCTFNVVFAPLSADPASRAGTLKISLQGDANPSTYTVNLAEAADTVHAAVGLPSLTFSPNPLVFPTTPFPITISAEQFVKITNCANAKVGDTCNNAIFSDFFFPPHFPIDWKPAAIPPPNGIPACSMATDDSSQFLAPGKSCVVGFTFKPTTKTLVTENFGIDLMCPPPCQGVVYNLALKGTGGDGPVLTFSPNPMVFKTPVAAGSTGAEKIAVTVTNSGNAVGSISGLPGAPGTPPSAFKLVANDPGATSCTPSIPISPGPPYPTCTLTFIFNPPAGTPAGVLTADPLTNPLTIFLAPNDSFAFSLGAIGTVIAGAPTGPDVTLSPNPMNFRAKNFDETDQETLTITNSGSGSPPLIIGSFSLGSGKFAFGFGAGCEAPEAIQPTKSCTKNITFQPLSLQPGTTVQDTLVLKDNTAAGQHTVQLIGVVVGPRVSLDNTPCTTAVSPCETVKILAPVDNPIVTLRNIGNADLHITNVSNPDAGTGFRKANDSCVARTISPNGGTCTLQFSFTPPPAPAQPWQTTDVTIDDDAGRQTITLLGGISGPAIIVTPGTNITFSTNVNIPVTTNITLTNVGSVDVKIPSKIANFTLNALGKGFFIGDLQSCLGKVLSAAPAGQKGDSCTFPVTFNPTSADIFNNSISITTSDVMDNAFIPPLSITILLTGLTGLAPTSPPGTVSGYGLEGTVDPVDGATGQFYEDELDLSLGGPLNLQFVRYYGSGLSSGGYKSSLGVNWMSNFDVGMTLNNNTAQVLLFRGKTVNFSKAGGSWTLVSPADIGYQFAAAGSGYQFMSPVSSLIYTFNSVGKLASIADLNGNVLTVTQGANGPTSISDGLGRTLTLTYTGGALTGVQDQAGRSVSYSYTGANLTSAIDALKKITQYTYVTAGTLAGLMAKKQLPAGNIPTTQTYDASGRVTAQTDGNGNTTQIGYDGKGGTIITHALGGVVQQGNNASGNTGQLTDPSGNSLNVTFDSAEHRTGVTDKMGNAVKFTYHTPSGSLASRTDELGATTSYDYTARTQAGFTFYDQTVIAFPDGTSTSMSYDANGNLISSIAADGATETKTYDSRGLILASSDANKQTTSFVYNSDGTLASRQDPLGNMATYSYTAAGQPSKINDPDGGVSAFTYDANGRLLTFTDPAGAIFSNRYDDNGQRVAVTDQDGGIFSFTYSPTGKLASINDPLGNKTVYAYDAEDRQTSATDAAGETISRTYDSVGHLMSLSDNRGPLVNYTYDPEGRILSQTDPTGKVTSFSYDPTGQLISTTKPDGTKYAFAYDKLGRFLSLANPLGETQSVTRDAMGRVTQVNLPGSLTSAIQFDVLGRMAAITSPNGNTWTLSNDALGRISSFTDPLGAATTRSYTGTRLTGMTLPLGTLAFTRDKNGRVTQRQYSDGTTINTAYDPMGLLTSADGVTIQRDVMGHPVNVNGIALTYTVAGRLATLTYAPGKTVTYAYDNAGRLASVGDWVGGQTTFTYDAASRLAGLTYPNGVGTTYSFDANGRLSGIAAGSLSSIALTRDADGKITSANRNLPTAPALQSSSQQFSYNAAAQMNSENFDAMGRALTETGRAYTWNLASQLTGFQDSVNSAALTYDGLGEFSSSNVSGATETFVFNHATRFPALSIVRQGGSDLRYYVYTPEGKPLYSIEAADNTRKFYHFDEMGNTTLLTGDDGSITDTYAITPYGDIADHVGLTENPFTWQGQYGVIQESQGLYFVRQRHYDASASRFLSPDPLTTPDPRSAEPYTYARGNPLFYVDPSGAYSWAQITTEQDGRDDNSLLPIFDASLARYYALHIYDPLENGLFNLVSTNPGLTWLQLKNRFASDAPKPLIARLPPTNQDVLYTCNKTGSCLPSVTAGLAVLVNILHRGNQVEVNATAIAAGYVVSHDGGSFVSNVVSHDGGSFVSNVVSHDGGSLITQDGGSVVSNDGGSVIGHDGSSVVSNDGSSIVAAGAGNIVAAGAGNIVAAGAGNIVAAGAGNIVAAGAGNIVAAVTGK